MQSFIQCGLPIARDDTGKISVVEQVGIDVLGDYIGNILRYRLKNVQAKNRVLSIDGGGAKGMIPLRILNKIEKDIGCKICEKFDVVAGTSAGGLIALCISLGLTCEEITELSVKMAKALEVTHMTYLDQARLFAMSKMSCSHAVPRKDAKIEWLEKLKILLFFEEKQRAEKIQMVLKAYLKEKRNFSDDIFEKDLRDLDIAPRVDLLIPSIMEHKDLKNVYPTWFSNIRDLLYHDHVSNVMVNGSNVNNILTAAATTSSVLNFITVQIEDIEFSDSGYLCTNPSAYGLTQCLFDVSKCPDLLLSLGTGRASEPQDRTAQEIAQIQMDPVSGLLKNNAEVIHTSLKNTVFKFEQYPHKNKRIYHRINPSLLADSKFCVSTISSGDQVEEAITIVDRWIEQNENIIQPVVQRLTD